MDIEKDSHKNSKDVVENRRECQKNRILIDRFFSLIESSLISHFSNKLKTDLYPLSIPPDSQDVK